MIYQTSQELAPLTVRLGVGNSPQIEPQILAVLVHPMHYVAGCYCNHTATSQCSLWQGQGLKISYHSGTPLLLSN